MDKTESGSKRLDNLTDMDKLVVGAQCVPLLYLLLSGNTYWGMIKCVFFQVLGKVVIMTAKQEVTKMVL